MLLNLSFTSYNLNYILYNLIPLPMRKRFTFYILELRICMHVQFIISVEALSDA